MPGTVVGSGTGWPGSSRRVAGRFVFWLALLAAGWLVSAAAAGLESARANPMPDPGAGALEESQVLLLGLPSAGLPGPVSVAVNDDVTALFANPAGIDRAVPMGYLLLWEEARHGRTDRATLALTTGPLGLGYQRSFNVPGGDLSRWTLALGGGTRNPVSVGVRGVYEKLAVRGPDQATWRWDAGLLWRPTSFVSLGATLDDFNQGKLGEQLYRRGQTVGLALRPLPGRHRARATLHADLGGRGDLAWKEDAFLRAGVSAEVYRGVALSGSVEGRLNRVAKHSDERVYYLGFGYNEARSTSWFGGRWEQNDAGETECSRTLYGVYGSSARQRTLWAEPVTARIKMAGLYGDEGQSGVPIPIPMLGSPSYASIRPVLNELERAAVDPAVRGVLLELGPLSAGALTSEVRDAIGRIRAAGKPVVAAMDDCEGVGQYHVASACDRIVLDPLGGVARLGLRADLLYFGEMLDSLGITMEKVAHGKYKTAGEQLVLRQASEGQKEALNSVLDDWRDLQLGDFASGRGMPREKMEPLCDGSMFTADAALAAGLVDTLADREGARKLLNRLTNRREGHWPVSLAGWHDRDDSWVDGGKVAVLWLDGAIVSGRSSGGFFSENTIGSETVVARLRALKKRRDVRAVVLRVDSPGGSALASDQIWRAVEEVQEKGKKIVVSMGRVAGSGGYYIACGADEIFADPATITGSIGVLGMKPHFAGFYRKHRIGVETFERGAMMGMYTSAEPLAPEERAQMLTVIDDYYEKFLQRVTAGRPLDRDQVDAVGQGRIWTGRQALGHKLIDRVAGLHEAVARAKELAGLPAEAKVVHLYRSRWSLRGMIADQASVAARSLGHRFGVCDPAPAAEAFDRRPSREAELALLATAGRAQDPWEAWLLRRSWEDRLRPGSEGSVLFREPLLDLLPELE